MVDPTPTPPVVGGEHAAEIRPDPLHAEVLPDSRLRPRSKGVKGLVQSAAGMLEPVFCASCSSGPHGWCPAQNMTFMYYVCTPCYTKLGDVVNTYVTPDEVFWEKVKQEQLDVHGRELAPEELVQVVAADASALSSLIKAGS